MANGLQLLDEIDRQRPRANGLAMLDAIDAESEPSFQVPQLKLGFVPDATIETPPEHPVITSRDPMQRFAQNAANLQRAKYIQQRQIRADELQNRINEGYPISPNEAAMYGDLLDLNEPPKLKKEKVPKGIYAGEQTGQMEQVITPEQPRTYTPDTRTPISLAEQTDKPDYVEPTIPAEQSIPTQSLPMGANETYGQIAERATRGVAMSALGAGADIAQGVWDTIKGVGDKAINVGEGILEPIIRTISRPKAGETPQIVSSSWERNALGKLDYYVSGMIGDVKEYTQNMRDNIHDELKDNYGTAVDITQTGAEMLSAATVMIGGMQAVGGVVPTTKADMVSQVAHGAALGYTITPGDVKAKQEGALIMGLFSAAGPLADKVIPSAALAKLSAVVANNIVSIPQYNAIVQNAKVEAEAEGTPDNWLMKAALPLAEAGAWTFMGMSAKGKPKMANKVNDVIIKAWSPEKWAKVIKALDMPLLKTVEPLEPSKEAITVAEIPSKVAIPAEPDIITPPAEIVDKVPLEVTKRAEQPISQPETKQPVVEQPLIQGEPNALQKPSPTQVDVLAETRNGKAVAKGNAEVQGVAGEIKPTTQGKVAEVKQKLIDFQVNYLQKNGKDRGKTWIQAKDVRSARNEIQKEFDTEGTGEKVTSAIKSKIDLTMVGLEGKPIIELAVGSKVKSGKSPQVNTIVEKLPQSAIERENNEQLYRVKNDKTGAVSTVEKADIKPITLKPTGSQQVKESVDLNKRLQELGLEPSVFKNKKEKTMAIKRAEEKGKVEPTRQEQAKQGGFVTALPRVKHLADLEREVARGIKLRLTTTKGENVNWNAIDNTARKHVNMYDIHNTIVGNRVETAVKLLTDRFDEPRVNKAVMELLRDQKTIDQFKTEFQLADNNPVVQELKWVLNDRAKFTEAIAKNLEAQGKKDIADIVRANKGEYLTRFYKKHVLGSSFVPEEADFADAVDTVKVELSKQVGRLKKRVGKLGNIMKQAKGISGVSDTQRYIETGDTQLISHLTDKQQDFARQLRDRYMGMKDLVAGITVDPAKSRGKLINLQQKTDAINTAARDTVDYILSNEAEGRGKGSSPIDVNHLTQRVLTPVFRKLFQEVDTPIESAKKTAEVQGRMLVGLETLNNIYEQGVGQWWTRSAPGKAKGLTQKLEGKRYGKLDGAFVSKATQELLEKQDNMVSEVGRMFENLVHYQRTIQVATSLPTTERNLLSGYASFATANGDVLRPGFHKNLKTAVGFVVQLAKAKKGTAEYTKLLETLETLAEKGVFHVSQTSTSADIMTAETNFGKSANLVDRLFSPLGKLQNNVGKMYAYGDFITKYASYLTQKQIGKSDAEAAEHVRKFYQSPSSLPTGLRWFSKLPLADYPTYTFDSIRIKKNEIVYAAESAAKGDLIPLLGFAISNGAYAMLAGGTSWVNGMLTDKMKEKIAALPDEQLRAMKAFQPDYWQNTPMFARNGKDDKGNTVIDYVITGNMFAFPLDDAIMGAIQNRKFSSLLDASTQMLGKTGMTINSISKLFLGQEVGLGSSYYKTKGLVDVWRSDSDHKVAETMGMVAKASIELVLPVPRRVQQSFKRWLAIDEKLVTGKITQEDAKEQKADILMSEVFPIKVRTVTRDVAHDMMWNTLKPSIDTIKELDEKVGKGLEKNATETQKQQGKEAEKDLRNKYSEVIDKVRLAHTAFKGVSSPTDIRKTIIDIVGSQENGQLIITGKLDILMKKAKKPSSYKSLYEKGKDTNGLVTSSN